MAESMRMESFDTNVRITEIQREIESVKEAVDQILKTVKPDDELYDNSDIIKNWKVSERTLATWRSKGLIGYVQIGGKIFYSKKDRDRFIERYRKSDEQ